MKCRCWRGRSSSMMNEYNRDEVKKMCRSRLMQVRHIVSIDAGLQDAVMDQNRVPIARDDDDSSLATNYQSRKSTYTQRHKLHSKCLMFNPETAACMQPYCTICTWFARPPLQCSEPASQSSKPQRQPVPPFQPELFDVYLSLFLCLFNCAEEDLPTICCPMGSQAQSWTGRNSVASHRIASYVLRLDAIRCDCG